MDALNRNAKRILTGAEAPAPHAQVAWPEPLTTVEYASLYGAYCAAQNADYRSCHGRRYLVSLRADDRHCGSSGGLARRDCVGRVCRLAHAGAAADERRVLQSEPAVLYGPAHHDVS